MRVFSGPRPEQCELLGRTDCTTPLTCGNCATNSLLTSFSLYKHARHRTVLESRLLCIIHRRHAFVVKRRALRVKRAEGHRCQERIFCEDSFRTLGLQGRQANPGCRPPSASRCLTSQSGESEVRGTKLNPPESSQYCRFEALYQQRDERGSPRDPR